MMGVGSGPIKSSHNCFIFVSDFMLFSYTVLKFRD